MTYTFTDQMKTNVSNLYHFGRQGNNWGAKYNQRTYTFKFGDSTRIIYFTQHTTTCSTVVIEEFGNVLGSVNNSSFRDEFVKVMEEIFRELYATGVSCILYSTGLTYEVSYRELLKELGFIKYAEYWNKQHNNRDKQVQLYKVLDYDKKPL